MSAPLLEATDIRVEYGGLPVVDGVSFSVSEGDWLMITGPNGAGKSTLISAVTQSARYSGKASSLGTDVRRIRPRELARRFGVLSQGRSIGYAFTVEEIVHLGRYSHTRTLFSGDDSGEAEIDAAVDITGLRPLLRHSALTLSGGELQRAFLAQLFAQCPSVLLLDEPTNHLDLVYQKQVFALISEWLKTPGRAVVSVVHDLSLALKYGTKAILLKSGKVEAEGAPRDALSRESLLKVYGMDVYEWMIEMLSQWEKEPD